MSIRDPTQVSSRTLPGIVYTSSLHQQTYLDACREYPSRKLPTASTYDLAPTTSRTPLRLAGTSFSHPLACLGPYTGRPSCSPLVASICDRILTHPLSSRGLADTSPLH